MDPRNGGAFAYRGIAKMELKNNREAIADFNIALDINPTNPDYAFVYSNRGKVKIELKDYQGAIADFSKTLEINPMYADVYYNRGVAYIQIGDRKNACIDIKKAASLGSRISAQWLNGADGDWCRKMS